MMSLFHALLIIIHNFVQYIKPLGTVLYCTLQGINQVIHVVLDYDEN